MLTRRKFLKATATIGTGLFLSQMGLLEQAIAGTPQELAEARRAAKVARVLAQQSPQVPLAAGSIPQFVDPLPGLVLPPTTGPLPNPMPGLDVIPAGTDQIVLNMT